MTDRFRSQAIPVVIALLVLGVVLARQWQVAGSLSTVPLDDAYIHYRFADNLATGHGFAFNPDEPTPGSTSPLWVVLLAAAEIVGLGAVFTSKLLGALSFVACAWLTWHIVGRLMGDNDQAKLMAVSAGALVALSGRVAWAALSGMETVAFAALTLLALDRLLDHPLNVATSALLGMAALLRPEGYLLFFFIVLLSLLSRPSGAGMSSILRLSSNVLVFALLVSPYALFSLSANGSLLPNTFRANARELTAAEYLVRYVRFVGDDNSVVFVLALLGLGIAERDRRLWPLAAWAAGFPLFAALLTPNLRHHGRYSIPLIPFYVLLAVVGLYGYTNRMREKLARRAAIVLSAAMLVLGLVSTIKWSGTFAADARDITQMQVTMARWVETHTPRSATLALSDIGAITYFSGRHVIDLVGLVTPDILPVVSGKPVGLERDQVVFDYLARHRPDYVIIIPTWYPYLASSPGSRLTEVHTVQLDHTPSVGGGDHLRAFQANWTGFDARVPDHPLSTSLGGVIVLDGFSLDPSAQVKVGLPLTLTLYWRSVEPAGRFKVFVHVLDTFGNIVAQNDGEPVGNLWPTHLWKSGDVIPDERVIALLSDAVPPGQYTLQVGMYDAHTGTRLMTTSGQDAVILGTVEVTR